MTRQQMTLRVRPEILKQYLTDNGLSGRALAERCDVGKSTIYRLVAGEQFIVNGDTADAIAQGLGKKTADLFEVARVSRVAPKCRGCGTACATCGPVAA